MIDTVAKEFKKITHRTCKKFADANSLPLHRVSLSISQVDCGCEMPELEYHLCKDYTKVEPISINKILGIIIIDFAQKGPMIAMFISKAFEEFSEEHKLDKKDFQALICVKGEEEHAIYIYHGKRYIKQVTIEQLFTIEEEA